MNSPVEQDRLDAFWEKYLEIMEDDDDRRAHGWDGNTTGILTFTGLFAATVAAFVLEGYQQLSVDAGEETVELLKILIAIQNSTALPAPASNDAFSAPISAIVANTLWFCSLVISLGCALLATLVQQWARDYKRDVKPRNKFGEDPLSRAYNHIYIRMGVDSYGMDQVVYLIISLVHLSVLLFAGGLLLFLFPLNAIVAWCTTAVLGLLGMATPLTYPLAVIIHCISWTVQRIARSLYALAIQFSCRRKESLSPQPPMQIKIIPLRRRIHRDREPLLRTRHFVFALSRYMSHQALSTDCETAALMQALLRIVDEHVLPTSRRACIDHLCENRMLRAKLQTWTWDPSHTRNLDPEAQVSVLQFTCVLLQRLRRIRDADATEEHRLAMKHCASILLNIVGPGGTLLTYGNARSAFRARCSLFYMRHFLLSLTGNNALSEHWSLYQNPKNPTERPRQFSLGAESMAGELLTLLNTPLYNAVDTIDIPGMPYVANADRQSCLVSLHDAACCRMPQGPSAHIAACSVLTMIAHIMYAPEPDRSMYLSLQPNFPDTFFFDNESVNGPSPFWTWFEYFGMSDEHRQLPPSAEFQAIIRDVARLGELRTVRDGLYESFVDALRNLQDHVDTRSMLYRLEGHARFGPWAKQSMADCQAQGQAATSTHEDCSLSV